MSTKSKEKRIQRQKETELLNNKRRSVINAEAIENILDIIPIFKKFSKIENCILVDYIKLSSELLNWAFKLTETNMKKLYEETWGWNETKKMSELTSEHARYFVLFISDQPVGFVHFRFEAENSQSQLYIYELQVESNYQKKGIGKFLMQACEFLALKTGMEVVMLTVLRNNLNARDFYSKNRYIPHPMSPSYEDPEVSSQYFHEILYKQISKK